MKAAAVKEAEVVRVEVGASGAVSVEWGVS